MSRDLPGSWVALQQSLEYCAEHAGESIPLEVILNKGMLVERVRGRYGNDLTAEEAVEAVLDAMVRELVRGGSVRITGFGTLDLVERGPHESCNPKTGEPVMVASSRRVRFRAGRNLVDLVNRRKSVPKWGSAIKKAPRGTVTRKVASGS